MALNPHQVNWHSILVTTQSGQLGVPSSTLKPNSSTLMKPLVNWDALGPAFLDVVDTKKNEHELNPKGIPDALQMMIHLKLFIPVSMLTTLSISCIWYNNNLKFKKIPFNYAVGKYALDDAHFPSEESLSDAEYMQAHKHWLTLIKISAEPSIYDD